MIYPEHYTEYDKLIYDNFRKLKLVEYGNNPKDYELIILNISCKNFVSNSKGEEYMLKDDEKEKMANVWKTYGQPNINNISI